MSGQERRVTIEPESGELAFVANEELCRTRAGRSVGTADWTHDASTGELTATASAVGWEVRDRIERTGPTSFRWRRRFTSATDETRSFDGAIELVTGYDPTWTMIPGASYGGNEPGDGNEPKGLSKDGVPWAYAANRASVPGATYSESEADGWSIALFAADDEVSLDGACSLEPTDGSVVHRLCWPERELPRQYAARDAYTRGWRSARYLGPDETVEVTAHLAFAPVDRPRTAWRSTLDRAWEAFGDGIDAWYGPDHLWDLGLTFARESLWEDSDEFTGFRIGLGRGAGEWVPNRHFEIGWVGQNAALATAFLEDYARNGSEESLEIAERTLDHWVGRAPLDCGLFRTRFNPEDPFEDAHSASGDRWEVNVDTCNLAHGIYQLLRAAEIAEEIGRPHPEWRKVALDACGFFVENQLDDGTYGKVWSFDGECLDESGTVGAFLSWALLEAYRATDDDRYLDSAAEAFETYVERDLDRMACVGGALDINCIDKETAWPLAVAPLDLYEITGDESYLARAEQASYYLATWQWHYSVPMPEHSMLDEIDYDTFGGTNVAVQHQCQDPWGALIAWPWLRLSEATGDDRWRERAVATWNQATIGVSDGTLAIDGTDRPAGSQDETYMYTYWGWPNESATLGDASRWLTAWPTAFRLFTLGHLDDWNVIG